MSVLSLPFAPLSHTGDVDGALAAADRCLHGQLRIGSQRHFYMEPQTAVATPEEGGRMNVISSCQGCDQVLWAVAEVLQLRHNQVHVSSRRVGGGFGGKVRCLEAQGMLSGV
jgi:xanthine dehydrogenase molybdopterin-binding subunit B